MKTSQVAVLCGAVLGGSLIVAATTCGWSDPRSVERPSASGSAATPAARRPVIAMMRSRKGTVFVSCRAGAEEAARELASS